VDGDKLSNLIIPLIQLIMFGMGTSNEFWDLSECQNSKRSIIGLSAQVIDYAYIGFLLASVSGFQQRLPQELF